MYGLLKQSRIRRKTCETALAKISLLSTWIIMGSCCSELGVLCTRGPSSNAVGPSLAEGRIWISTIQPLKGLTLLVWPVQGRGQFLAANECDQSHGTERTPQCCGVSSCTSPHPCCPHECPVPSELPPLQGAVQSRPRKWSCPKVIYPQHWLWSLFLAAMGTGGIKAACGQLEDLMPILAWGAVSSINSSLNIF